MRRSAIATALVSLRSRLAGGGIARRILFKGAGAACWAWSRTGRPLATYGLDGAELLLPMEHSLPINRALHPDYSANAGRLAAAVQRARPGSAAIDIGANVGDTAAIWRAVGRFPILCIEGDPAMTAILDLNLRRLGGGIAVEASFVGGEDGLEKASLVRTEGTARLVSDGSGGVAVRSLASIVASHAGFARPGLVKTDTDGHDCAIVISSAAWLAEVRPVVFLEYDPHFFPAPGDGRKALAALRDAGYARALLWDNRGDFLAAIDLGDTALVEDLDAYHVGRGCDRYLDIAAFHADDAGVASELRAGELALRRAQA